MNLEDIKTLSDELDEIYSRIQTIPDEIIIDLILFCTKPIKIIDQIPDLREGDTRIEFCNYGSRLNYYIDILWTSEQIRMQINNETLPFSFAICNKCGNMTDEIAIPTRSDEKEFCEEDVDTDSMSFRQYVKRNFPNHYISPSCYRILGYACNICRNSFTSQEKWYYNLDNNCDLCGICANSEDGKYYIETNNLRLNSRPSLDEWCEFGSFLDNLPIYKYKQFYILYNINTESIHYKKVNISYKNDDEFYVLAIEYTLDDFMNMMCNSKDLDVFFSLYID